MEQNGKLGHSIVSLTVAWILAFVYWLGSHIGLIIGILAGAASIYSMIASRASKRASDEAALAAQETIKLRRKQQSQLTSGGKQEPDTET